MSGGIWRDRRTEISKSTTVLDLGSFQNVILERNALRVVFLEPSIGSDLARKDLQVNAVANLLAGVDVNPDCHWSLLSFLRPQCGSFRAGLNSRMWWRFNARMMPIFANITGPPSVATRIKASIAACHSGVMCSAFGSLAIYVPASCSVTS